MLASGATWRADPDSARVSRAAVHPARGPLWSRVVPRPWLHRVRRPILAFVLVVAVTTLTACSSSSGGSSTNRASTTTSAPTGSTTTLPPGNTTATSSIAPASATLKIATAPWQLPSPRAREVVLAGAGALLVIGGPDPGRPSPPRVLPVP